MLYHTLDAMILSMQNYGGNEKRIKKRPLQNLKKISEFIRKLTANERKEKKKENYKKKLSKRRKRKKRIRGKGSFWHELTCSDINEHVFKKDLYVSNMN